MNLYIITDTHPDLDPDRASAAAVWAPDIETALRLASGYLDSFLEEHTGEVVDLADVPAPAQDGPHIETRYEVLHPLGWGDPDAPCLACWSLAWLPHFVVCPECQLCRDCARDTGGGCGCAA